MVKRGKALGGKPPRRGGRLTSQYREPGKGPDGSQILALTLGCLLFGLVAGFGWAMDRQLRGGILEQRQEALDRPDWVPLEQLPPYLSLAVVSVVDPGFDGGGAMRPRERGQTISRELVREIHLLDDGLSGQARELVMAPILEQRIDRQDMLELYLNRVHFGFAHDYPVYGVHDAAREYFGKAASELTLGEAATLAGLLLSPRIEHPEELPGAAGVRRNEVLRMLLRAGYIDSSEFQAAVAERLAFQPGVLELPMTRALLTPADTAIIRLPAESPDPPE